MLIRVLHGFLTSLMYIVNWAKKNLLLIWAIWVTVMILNMWVRLNECEESIKYIGRLKGIEAPEVHIRANRGYVDMEIRMDFPRLTYNNMEIRMDNPNSL